jgi:hypothetical protein
VSYVVIAQSPSVDVSQVIGPFKSQARAIDISDGLTAKGYNTEVCPLVKFVEVDYSPPWDLNES